MSWGWELSDLNGNSLHSQKTFHYELKIRWQFNLIFKLEWGHSHFVFLSVQLREHLTLLCDSYFVLEMNHKTSVITAFRFLGPLECHPIEVDHIVSSTRCFIQLTLNKHTLQSCTSLVLGMHFTSDLQSGHSRCCRLLICISPRGSFTWFSPPLAPGWRPRPPWVKWGVKEQIDSVCRAATIMKNRLCQLTLTAVNDGSVSH